MRRFSATGQEGQGRAGQSWLAAGARVAGKGVLRWLTAGARQPAVRTQANCQAAAVNNVPLKHQRQNMHNTQQAPGWLQQRRHKPQDIWAAQPSRATQANQHQHQLPAHPPLHPAPASTRAAACSAAWRVQHYPTGVWRHYRQTRWSCRKGSMCIEVDMLASTCGAGGWVHHAMLGVRWGRREAAAAGAVPAELRRTVDLLSTSASLGKLLRGAACPRQPTPAPAPHRRPPEKAQRGQVALRAQHLQRPGLVSGGGNGLAPPGQVHHLQQRLGSHLGQAHAAGGWASERAAES